MDEVRCPMCGKNNPAEAEICQYCEARLKPLILNPAASEGEQDLPDWLRSLRSDAGEPEGELPPEPDAQPEIPDWFSGQEQPEPAELPPLPAASELEPASSEEWGSLSDWLTNLKTEDSDTAPEAAEILQIGAEQEETLISDAVPLEEPVEPAGPGEALSFTEWLSESPGEAPPPVDWLEGEEAEAQPSEAPPAPAMEEPAALAEQPDWLSLLAGENPEENQPPVISEPEAGEPAGEAEASTGTGLPDSLFGDALAEPAEELPDWLNQIDHTQESVAGSVPAFTLEAEQEQLAPEEQAALEEATAEALSMPDWVAGITAEPTSESGEAEAAPEVEPGIAQAKLPDWLEAMRPVEAVAPESAFLDQTDDRMESAGPLAGLRGVIPGDLGAPEQHKPPAYEIKVPVGDDQQARLALLQALVASEGAEKTVSAHPARTDQLILRLVVFALLVLLSVTALWMGSQTPLPMASQIAPEVIATRERIDSLRPDQPILFVVDYEPGFMDEMNTVVMPVLDHLAIRGAHVVFLSTSPTGPILAADLVRWENQQPLYAASKFTGYTNLGYLPGGANGIRAFAQAPAQTMPHQLDGSLAWVGPLAGVQQGLDQFTLVVVASDDPEGARQWIEQVGPLLQGKTPLILLTSAQAGPVVQPYVGAQAGLVSGLVSGMAGGAEYFSATARPSKVPLYWDALSLTLNGVVVIIVLGGFVGIALSSVNQRKAQKGEENT